MESNDRLEQLLRQMYAQESLLNDEIDTKDIVDEEWTKFEAEYFENEEFSAAIPFSFKKIAAMIVGVLMLSGIAYAAVQMMNNSSQKAQEEQMVATANAQPSTVNPQLAGQDSTLVKPVVFEDAELVTILDDIATFYQVEPVFKQEASKHIRLYFTWNKKQSLDDIIDTFNKFERIHITRYDKILIIE